MTTNTGKLTLAQAQREARTLGYSIRSTGWGDLRCAPITMRGATANMRGAIEAQAYYTDDVAEALHTVRALAAGVR